MHRGAIEMRFGDGSSHRLGEGSFARVDASTPRKIRILGPEDAVYVCAGGKDGCRPRRPRARGRVTARGEATGRAS